MKPGGSASTDSLAHLYLSARGTESLQKQTSRSHHRGCLAWPGLTLPPGASSVSSYLQDIWQPSSLNVNNEAEVTDKAQELPYFAFLLLSKKAENQSENLSWGALVQLAGVA